jgi:hypothetical protein
MLRSYLPNPAQLPPLLHTVRTSLFPNNAPAPPRGTPDAAEQRAVKRNAAECILDLVPAFVAERFFASPLDGQTPAIDIE